MLSEEIAEDLDGMLGPEITQVCFFIGGHYLKCWDSDDFDERFSVFLKRLLQNNRKVLVLTVSHWAIAGDISRPDVENNARIDRLNARMVKASRDLGVPVMDFQQMLQGKPHSDYIHCVKDAYIEPASFMVQWFQSDGVTSLC